MTDLVDNQNFKRKGIKDPRSELTVSRVFAFVLFVDIITGHRWGEFIYGN